LPLNIQDIAMKKLTEQEELIMTSLWDLEKAFVKDIVANITQNLHYNTVSTVVRKLENKGFISHESFGNTHRYFPKISKEQYSEFVMEQESKKFFDGSYKEMVSYFAEKEKISQQDLEEILQLIKNK
jgi:predicted transcriptional regulator